ncbi:MAG: serine acetyltransferase [Candidatus Latescibacteria bacterium]|nr:serine acetyltransferase [Candidatus Latescibacterota bacterium]
MIDVSIERLSSLSKSIEATYEEYGGINRIDGENLPSRTMIIEVLNDLFAVIFPGYFGKGPISRVNIPFHLNSLIHSIYTRLSEEIEKSLNYECKIAQVCFDRDCRGGAEQIALALLEGIPEIRKLLWLDVQAAYDGDPAAKSHDEIILSYPCLIAITTYRIAHELYRAGVPLVPRVMGEWAHGQTGVDIHPGAHIGERFFIDHGTGVVIGETTVIGNDVKIYQGVTLGAMSFRKDASGKVIKGGRRHPTIEDNVTIYSGATILGGDTVIGRGSVIGGNVWLTSSVPPGTTVTITPYLEYKEKREKKAVVA